MLKCLAVICILGLVSAADWENAQAGKRSQRLNLLSRTVGARMTAGTNGQMDSNFQSITPTGNNNQQQFVPIARQNTAGINSIAPTGGQVMDNSLTGGQQLTPEQIQQLHSFLTAQQQSQQQPTGQLPTGQQPMSQQPMSQQPMTQQPMTQQTGQQSVVPPVGRTMTNNMPQQPQQPQQMFRMDSTGVTGGMNTPTENVDQTARFNQGRMMMPTQQQQQPAGAAQSTPVEATAASKPSALEQQLLDQQVLTQRLKEQLQQLQQQQRTAQTPSVATNRQPAEQQQQMFANQQQQQVEQLTQEQKMQRMTSQQQQQQQQQLLDQINQLNQMNQQQGRTVAQQQPAGVQQQPTTQQNFGRTNQMMPNQPMMPTQQMMPTQPMMPTQQMMPTNTSRMVMGVQQQQPQQQQRNQGRVGGGDICANAKPGELMPHPLDETQFLVCNELGEITLMDCPNHTVFNPHLKLCDLTSEMPLLCKANPCLNGAKCVEVSPVQFQCECPQGFSGKTCEKFDTCQSSRPCGSDGVCLSFALGSPIPHVCLCNGGRSVGLTCDKQTEQNPCTLSGSSTKLMPVAFSRAVFAHCEGARPHFKFCQPPLMFSASKQACEWSF